jgi:protein SCO1/2
MKILYFIASSIFLSALTVSAHEGHKAGSTSEISAPVSGESIYNLKSTWINQDGKTLKLSELAGKKLILAMGYTGCEHACSLIVEDMKKIEAKAGDHSNAVFAFFSFDTEKDSPKKLKDYAEKRKLSNSWLLFNGSKKAVKELAAVLGIKYSKLPNGDFDHSNLISLIDKEGVIRYQQIGLNKDGEDFLKFYKELGE